jgi:hypothetical protein
MKKLRFEDYQDTINKSLAEARVTNTMAKAEIRKLAEKENWALKTIWDMFEGGGTQKVAESWR